MFGVNKAAVTAEQQTRDGNYEHAFEYKTVAAIGHQTFDKLMNEHAAVGWELVNGSLAGTTFCGFFRRPLKPKIDAA